MLDRSQLIAAARRHDDQRPHLLAAAVVDARSFQVPAAQSDRVVHVEIEALERVARHGEFDDPRAAVRVGNRFTIRRLREERGTANLSQVDVAFGIDVAGRIDHPGRARRTLLVRRQPALHLRVDALEARGVLFARGPARLQLRVGKLIDVVIVAGVIRRRPVRREQ